ncbi:MAG: class A beta-lactamase-related serine hydrolase [Chitinophagaceae bacterium]|nr:MAG: class A beta-lactamase-related serine hydrolase [Chitinophagaceae bacterium]
MFCFRKFFSQQVLPVLLAATLTITSACSQSALKETSPESAGFSSARLKGIDSLVQVYIDSNYIEGATALIAKDGKIVYYKGIGVENLKTKERMKRDEIFRIASQTKAITCVAIMILMDEGKLKLDDPISKYIAEFKNQVVLDSFHAADTTYTTVPVKRDITIRDLMTHTSGIDYAQIGSDAAVAIYAKNGIPGGLGVVNTSLADKMRLLGKMPLLHQPGEKWTYGLNMDLLGYLIEVIGGMPLDQFFLRKIFTPLGMTDTWFYLPENKYNRLVALATEDTTGHVLAAMDTTELNGMFNNNYPASKGTYFSGGGGLSSTVYDYAVFLQMLLNKGTYNGKRILKPESVAMMSTDQIPGIPFGESRFGLGFSIATKESQASSPLPAGSYGWGGFFSTTYWVDPSTGIVGVFYLNQFPNSHREIHVKFQQLVYNALIKK